MPTARDAARREAAVRREGGRPRRRQGRLGLPHTGGARRGTARGGGARAAVPRRGAARGRGGVDLRACATDRRRCRCRPPRTTSASATTTRAPNTGGMGSYSPVPRLDDDEVAELVELACTPVLEELARRGTPFIRRALRGADADRRRAARARVQLPLRRPRDAVAAAAARGRPARGARRLRGRRSGGTALPASAQAAVTVVLAARDYPERGDSGTPIEGVDDAEATGALVFHAGYGAARRAARDERRPDPQRHRARRLDRRRACCRIRRRVAHRFRRRAFPDETSPPMSDARRRDPRRLGVGPRADAGRDRRARRGGRRLRVRGALGAPHAGRGRRIRAHRARARPEACSSAAPASRPRCRASSPRTPTCR